MSAWDLALVIGLVAALIVAALLLLLIQAVRSIEGSVHEPARRRRPGRREHVEHPAAPGHRAGARADHHEAVVQDGYMNALTDGWGGVAA